MNPQPSWQREPPGVGDPKSGLGQGSQGRAAERRVDNSRP